MMVGEPDRTDVVTDVSQPDGPRVVDQCAKKTFAFR
jgi:hypothetical protein